MRMVWSLLIVVGAGTIVAMGHGTPLRTDVAVEEPVAQRTVGISYSLETLTMAVHS